MEKIIKIGRNSFGFTKSQASISYEREGMSINGLAPKNSSSKHLINLYNFLTSLFLFGLMEYFIIYQLFDTVFKSWSNPIVGIDGFIKFTLGFGLLVIAPYILSYWFTNKIFQPLRIKNSIQKSVLLLFSDIKKIELGEKAEIDIWFFSGKENYLTLELEDKMKEITSFCMMLLFRITTRPEEFSRFIGGKYHDENENPYFLIQYRRYSLKIFETEILATYEMDGENNNHSLPKTYYAEIINYLFIEAKNFNEGIILEEIDEYIQINKFDNLSDKINEISERLNHNVVEYNKFLRKFEPKTKLGENNDDNAYKIQLFPKIHFIIDYKKGLFGKYDLMLFCEDNVDNYYGREFISKLILHAIS